ncbi:hypothetical protein [Candidatus Desulforudis audaxviator]|uniref:Type I restriction enzyme R protein N-terminal domain-containing protein n=1 Tax=Desulforudis audaxviator (strain MP104C) TaxID=477974 RepID=B1I2A0_DESAP|nr:hypothetical protein [Candidatus Desulforudis audaxviator]ACA59053.1 conserved hypothetical protein [Candidatus Desulforudis audaxviator MP104C]
MAVVKPIPSVWQIAAGPATRPYADIFLRYGVGLIGPGDAGPWKPERDDIEFEGGFVRRFASEMEIGDVVLLRTGIATITAVGIVASEYLYLEQFDDVNGWDLQHARRIRWCALPQPYTFDSQVFGANPARCSRVRSEEVVEYALRFINSPPTQWQTAPLPDLPQEEPPLSDVPTVISEVVAQAQDLVPLYWDSGRFGDLPTEDELVGHFVLPLLRSLGWPPECIAVKWRYIDVAVFSALPRIAKNCQFVVEVKRLGAGVEGALKQAKGYLESFGTPRDVVVTDGIRYRLYSSQDSFAPVAYANLVRLKASAVRLFDYLKRR